MATVKIDEKLLKEVQKWLDENGNKYKHPTISAFVNSAVYEKLNKLRADKK
jgi:hypothetical protein